MFFYNESGSEVSQVQPTVSDPYFYNTSLLLKMDSDFGDSSVHQHTVTVNGNSTISSAESKYGGASGYFDGNGDYLHIPASTSYATDTDDFTIEFWYNPLNTNSVNPNIIANYNTTWQSGRWTIHAPHSSYTNKYTFWTSNYGSTPVLTSTSNISLNTWTHIAITREGNIWRMFIDGNLESSRTSSTSLDNGSGGDGLYVGATKVGTGDARYINAYIDDLRITKGVARYTANFTPPDSHPTTGPSEIVSTDLQLHLDAGDTNSYPGTGTTWYDLTSNNLDGTLIDGVTFDSADGGSLVFDASLDYVSIPKTITSVDFTVCQFVKHVSNTNFAWLFSQYKLDSSDVGRLLIQIEPVGSEDKVNFYMGGSSVYGDTSISSGQIYYISCVKAGDNVKIYINGVLDGEGSVPNVAPSNVVCSIGGAPNFPASWRDQTQLIGNVYKTEVYNRALSDAEVLQNFEATKSRFGL